MIVSSLLGSAVASVALSAIPPKVAQPESVSEQRSAVPQALSTPNFDYSGTWELTYRDAVGAARTVRFGIPSALSCPETVANGLPAWYPVIVDRDGVQTISWGRKDYFFETPELYLAPGYRVGFFGASVSQNQFVGEISYTKCRQNDGQCTQDREPATMTLVQSAPNVERSMVRISSEGEPVRRDDVEYRRASRIADVSSYAYYIPDGGHFTACAVSNNDADSQSLNFYYGFFPEYVFNYRNEESDTAITVPFERTSAMPIGANPFVFRWEGQAATGERAWIDFTAVQ